MGISQIDAVGMKIPFSENFPLNYGTEQATHHIFVRVKTDTGGVGYGEGTALPWFTGDVAPGLEEIARDWIAPSIMNDSLDDAFVQLRQFQDTFPGAYGAMAAVEMALLDLKAKRFDVPVHELLGAKLRDSIPIVSVLPAHDTDTTARKATEEVEKGYRHLKIKANGNTKTDIERIEAVLEVLPERGTLRIDANTAWKTYPTAAKVLSEINEEEKIEYVEQPVAVNRVDHMRRLWEEFGIPIYADESVNGIADVERYGNNAQISGCHLKLAKSGSLLTLATMAERAKKYDMTVSVVSAFGTSLEATANLHLASVVGNLSQGVEICTDLLADSYGSPALEQAPKLSVPTKPGIGVTIDDTVF